MKGGDGNDLGISKNMQKTFVVTNSSASHQSNDPFSFLPF
jgi:hypothetical protein